MPGGRLQATVQFKHSPADPHQTQALSQGSPMQGKVINLRTLIQKILSKLYLIIILSIAYHSLLPISSIHSFQHVQLHQITIQLYLMLYRVVFPQSRNNQTLAQLKTCLITLSLSNIGKANQDISVQVIPWIIVQVFSCTGQQNQQKMKNSTEVTLTRQNTNGQGESKRKVMAFLQTALKQQSQRREQAERELLQYRQRSLRIESQFSRLIEKYDNHVAAINGRLTYSQQIWNKLIKEIENFNSNSEMMLEKKCGQITSMMDRRVGEILERTDLEIKKHKKLSEEEFKTIREEIREVLTLAREIDTENQKVKRENQQLHFKVNILREEKTLLVEQLAQKKMLLKKLAQMSHEEQTATTIDSPRRGRSRLSSKGPHQTQIPKFMCEPSLKNFSSLVDNPQSNRVSSSKGSRDQKPGALTENHLKLVIERERRKNKELKNQLVRAQNKCIEVNSFLDRALQESTQEEKAGAVGHLLSAIKVKLAAAESPYNPSLTKRDLQQLDLF